MKKIKFALAIFISLFLSFGTNLNVVVAAGDPDQQCDAYNEGGGYTTIIRDSDYLASQSFTPGVNRLSRVDMTFLGDGNGEVSLALLKDGAIIAFSTSGMLSEPDGTMTLQFEFNDVEMTVGYSGYKLLPIYSVGNTSLFQYKKTACYDGGAAYLGSTEQSFDFDFAAYGFNYTEPSSDISNPGNTSDNPSDTSTVSDGSSTSLVSGTETIPDMKTTSYSIKAISDLAAADTSNDQGGSIDLAWTKSTTVGVEGYQVYRKDSEDADYEAIVAVDKDQLTYTDTELETNKIYFYSVRAYKGDIESVDSNEAQAEAIDNIAPEAPKNFKITKSTVEAITVSWDANSDEDLAGYYLTVIKNGESAIIKISDISEGETSYTLQKSDLEGDLDEVNLYLQAKDDNGNFSERSGPVTSAFVDSASASTTSLWAGIIAFLALIGIIIFLIWRKKKIKK